MQKKFLGDAKDSFKWDYHNYLTVGLRCTLLNVVLMVNSKDKQGGDMPPKQFPAGEPIWEFCNLLRDTRDFNLLRKLPKVTDASYRVKLTGARVPRIIKGNQVVFFDPDTGFEPPSGWQGEEHLRFREIKPVLSKMPDDTVVSVFQHARRYSLRGKRNLDWTYHKHIKHKLCDYYSTAIRWEEKVMFVILAKSRERIDRVRVINRQYCESKGGVVELLDNPLSDSNIRQKEKK